MSTLWFLLQVRDSLEIGTEMIKNRCSWIIHAGLYRIKSIGTLLGIAHMPHVFIASTHCRSIFSKETSHIFLRYKMACSSFSVCMTEPKIHSAEHNELIRKLMKTIAKRKKVYFPPSSFILDESLQSQAWKLFL